MIRPVRVAAFCSAGLAAILLLEAIWVAVASSWSEAAREWAGPHPLRHATQLVLGALFFAFVARSLLRGRRWAWYVAIFYSALVSVGGTLAVLVLGVRLFAPGAPVPGFAQPHLFETAMGVCSVVLSLACFFHLGKKETRDYFSLRKQPNSPVQEITVDRR